MSTYVVGDIQGCFDTFQKLLDKIQFNPKQDRLWLVGDLVNRGPHSLEVLRWCVKHKKILKAVLGNHDVHLLCRIAGISEEKALDTLDEVLKAPDLPELTDWLRQQSFVYHEKKCLLVHAGVLPEWSLSEIIHFNKQAQAKLSGENWQSFLNDLRNSVTPDQLIQALRVFTQIRMCKMDGSPEFKFKGSPDKAPQNLLPWYDFPARKTADQTILFGHWAALGFLDKGNVIGLDSGCVWGKELSTICLEDRQVFQQKSVEHDLNHG